ncbi:MAG: amidohydrolase family protein [Acidimicrobiales bacterium]|nr:amidohydrolase family protein [Acidimicrobiales bacterium]
MANDLVIRGGTVIDGSGRSRFRADVGIRQGRISQIGRIRERGAAEVDAEGHFVAPGFIDGHTHLDAQVGWDPLGTCPSLHGVTTVVTGNCGFSVAPCRESEKEWVFRSLERAEDIPRAALMAGVDWKWETFPDYLDWLDRIPKGINYSSYIGHSALRTYVMGERAFEEAASDDHLEAMVRELRAALSAGAMGFTTSRSRAHATADDRPVASRLAEWSEVEHLVGVLDHAGPGVFELANETHTDPGERREFYGRLRDLAVASGRPVTFLIGEAPDMPGTIRDSLALIDETWALGGRMYGEVHVRQFSSVVGFKSNLPFDKLPVWRDFRSQPIETQRVQLADLAVRARLVEATRDADYGVARGPEARAPRYDQLLVLDTPLGPHRTVADVAAERRCDPLEAMIDLSLEADLDLFFMQPIANIDLESALGLMRHPRTVVAASDSGAHVSQLIDSSIPTFLLGYWVRQREELDWEEAIRLLTFNPALFWGFRSRGLVTEGFAADLAIFDPEQIGPTLPTAAHDLPGQALRLKQGATGIRATVVNGQVLLHDGAHSGSYPGQLLRSGMTSGT